VVAVEEAKKLIVDQILMVDLVVDLVEAEAVVAIPEDQVMCRQQVRLKEIMEETILKAQQDLVVAVVELVELEVQVQLVLAEQV
jgi:hypothetical protein|tara:strand:+ start:124 stop:375 length:252 start_codon:yes stop_codon:yes gene_type:complete